MKITGVIEPDFKFSTLWERPLAESIPKFFSQVILPQDLGPVKITRSDQPERMYCIGVVSCFTLFPLLTLPLYDLLHNNKDNVNSAVKETCLLIALLVFCLVSALTALAAAVLTLPAIVPIAMARGGYEFFKTGGVLDYCKISIAETFKSKST